MLGRTKAFPPYLQGFGQDTSTVLPSWITDVFKPVAEVVKEYYDLQYQQQYPQAQQVLQSTQFPSISPIYLIAGGVVLWYLFRGGVKGQSPKRRKAR